MEFQGRNECNAGVQTVDFYTMHFVEGEVVIARCAAPSAEQRHHALSESVIVVWSALLCLCCALLYFAPPVGCRLESHGCLLQRWTGLSGLWLIRGDDRSGVGGGGNGSVGGEEERFSLPAFADQYLVGSRSFHPCDHGKRNLALQSLTTTRISLTFFRAAAAANIPAAILVEIKSSLETVPDRLLPFDLGKICSSFIASNQAVALLKVRGGVVDIYCPT